MNATPSGDESTAADSDPTESAADVHFTYRRERTVDRTDRYGRLMRWIGSHPISAGLAGGSLVVVVAALAVPRGIATAPLQAGILSLMVIAIWGVLFYFMREFFLRQSQRAEEEEYRLEASEKSFRFDKNGAIQVEIEAPAYTLKVPPNETISTEYPERATRVWLFVRGDGEAESDELFVLETKVTAGEASQYPTGDPETRPDETLPIHLASGLLQLADRAG